MRIAIFTDAYLPDINGVATSCSVLYHELIRHGHKVLIVTTSLPKNSEYTDNDHVLRIHGMTLKKLYGYRLAFFYNHPAMKYIQNFHPDLIHTQTEFGIGLFGRIAAEVLHCPAVYTYHTMYADYSHYLTKGLQPLDFVTKSLIGRLSKLYGNHCTHVIVPSKKAADALRKMGVKKKISVIPTGLDLQRFRTSSVDSKKVMDIRKKYNLDHHFTILFLGRIAEEKSIDFLIYAMKKIIPVKRDVRMMIVGGGPQLNELKRLTQRLGLTDYIIFTGPKVPEDVPAYYQACDVFACASLSETQGLTYLEAMASGLPVFARYDHNLDEVIKDGVNGFFFSTENEYVRKVIDLKRETAINISKQAVLDAQNYSSDDFYKKVMEVYMELVEQFKHYQVTEVNQGKSTAEVFLSNPKQSFHFKVDLITLKKYEIQRGKIISQDIFDMLKDTDGMRRCYQMALKMLSYHDYTEKQLRDKILQKADFSRIQMDMAMQALSSKHLIDDYDYAVHYISHCLKHGYGFNKASADLLKKGVKESVIDEALSEFDESEAYATAMSLLQKYEKMNNTRSLKALIDNMKAKLFRRGFSRDLVERVINDADIQMSQAQSQHLLAKDYQKFYRRYEKKYQGKELFNKIKKTLLTKGYPYEQVNEMIKDKWSEANDND